MNKDPHLYVIHNDSIQPMPDGSLENFLAWVKMDGEKPSVALRRVMEKYDLAEIDASVTIHFLKQAFPKFDETLGAFRTKLVDSGYPNVSNCSMSDEEFDFSVEKQVAE